MHSKFIAILATALFLVVIEHQQFGTVSAQEDAPAVVEPESELQEEAAAPADVDPVDSAPSNGSDAATGPGCTVVKCTANTTCAVINGVARCVPITKCPAGEVLSQCDFPCQATCADPDRPPCPTLVCGKGDCVCPNGQVRKVEGGKCVPRKSCECQPNEVFKDCASACEPTCSTPNPICIQICKPGKCQCKPNYFRYLGRCITEKECPAGKPCPKNEEFKQCGTACEPSCKVPNPQICTEQCILNVCQCKPGFVRNGPGGRCILDNQCPKAVPVEAADGEAEQ